jgi:hypothetical protein
VAYGLRDREQAIELALELLATGRVRGICPDHEPPALERLLGPPSGEGILTFSGNLLRDWNVLEAYYERTHDDAPWRGILLMGQLHRMRKPLKWKLIAGQLRRLGYHIVPVPRPPLTDRYFHVVESGSEAVVNGDDAGHTLPRGHLAKISAPEWLPMTPPVRRYQFNAVHRAVFPATGQPERSWPQWLASHQPEPDPEFLRLAHAAVHTVAREHPERAYAAAGLHDWVLARAEAAHVWSNAEQALLTARCAAGAPFHPLPARPGSPSSDLIIGRCLGALPFTRESAPSRPADWRDIAPPEVHRAKLTRALLRAADRVVDQATDRHLIGELAAWNDLLPRLC